MKRKTKFKSKKEIHQEIKKRKAKLKVLVDNHKFYSLKVPQKRVAIAKDVLAAVTAKLIIPTTGTYFAVNSEILKASPGEELQRFLLDASKDDPCTACALGSCFAAKVRLGDRYKLPRHYNDSSRIHPDEINSDARNQLKAYFTERQLSLIESAFEMKNIDHWIDSNYTEGYDNHELNSKSPISRAIHFGNEYTTDEDRLIAIMENIIKNKGTFVVQYDKSNQKTEEGDQESPEPTLQEECEVEKGKAQKGQVVQLIGAMCMMKY